MIVLLAAFISLSPSISSSKVCASSAQHINTSGLSIQILYPCNNSIEAVAGSKLEITCRVLAELHMGKILMYWLANHTYIEDYSKSNRVKEIRTLWYLALWLWTIQLRIMIFIFEPPVKYPFSGQLIFSTARQ
ncbi:uncharacterized protein [Narcine bancroftii]|uniref:uncharacterized protein isoform X3 n=1 Tax=Narcine bancroftii TaxID=1343680 RepID=UPI0038316785